MYRILNPMNHNVSLVRNDKGEEVIVIGKGIAFGKKKGDLISEDQVEKIFRMKTEESRENFMARLKDVPLDFITVTYEIIDKLSKKYHYPIQEYLYVTLTDHIYCSYQALTQGRYKDSNLRWSQCQRLLYLVADGCLFLVKWLRKALWTFLC